MVLGLPSPRVSTAVPRALPTPAFPKQQTLRASMQVQHRPHTPQTQAHAQPWSQFDFTLPAEEEPTEKSPSHSISSSISSGFSRSSSEIGTSSWSPTTTHQSKSSDGDQFFHAQTSDCPPLPQKPIHGSPPPRYAFAKTATARKMSLSYHPFNPRTSSIGAVGIQQQAGVVTPVLVRPTMITVPRPRTSSGVPGSPRFRNSSIPPHVDGSKPRRGSQGHEGHEGHEGRPATGLGLGMEAKSEKLTPRASTPKENIEESLHVPRPSSVKNFSPVPGRRSELHLRSATSTPLLTNSRSSTSPQPKELVRRRTDMDPPTNPPANPRKFSLFPCPSESPVILKDTPTLNSPLLSQSMGSRSISVSSFGRPRTSGGEKPSIDSSAWDIPLPTLPVVPPQTSETPKASKGKKGGKEKGEKTTFKSLRKHVLSGFQTFSSSLKLKGSSSSKIKENKSGSRDSGTNGSRRNASDEAPIGIGVAA